MHNYEKLTSLIYLHKALSFHRRVSNALFASLSRLLRYKSLATLQPREASGGVVQQIDASKSSEAVSKWHLVAYKLHGSSVLLTRYEHYTAPAAKPP
jgi:hypothetical protein